MSARKGKCGVRVCESHTQSMSVGSPAIRLKAWLTTNLHLHHIEYSQDDEAIHTVKSVTFDSVVSST